MRWTELFARKPVADHRGHVPEAHRVLGAGALVAMGIGATIKTLLERGRGGGA